MIDGDNIPRTFRPEIEREAGRLGGVVICQLFADITLHSDWSKEAGIDIHHCSGKQGSNAADIALVISALDLAYRGLAQGFLIVSNDRDFAPLLRHLVKIGCGAAVLKTPPKAASPKLPQALAVPVAKKAKEKGLPEVPVTRPAAADEAVIAKIKNVIRNNGGREGLQLAKLNNLFSRSGFLVSKTPEKQWRTWLHARPDHFELDPKGPESRVRVVAAKS